MNIHVSPESSIPETDEDDAGRKFYFHEIQKIHERTLWFTLNIIDIDKGDMWYLCKRVRLIWYLAILRANNRITSDRYIELSSWNNGDIMYSWDLRNNYDAVDSRWESIYSLMDW